MKERDIKKKVYAEMKKQGYVGWSAPKVKFSETDIFGIFDGVFVKGEKLRFIQWTTDHNVSARVKKIKTFFEENKVFIPCEVWGIRQSGEFKIVNLEK